MMCAVADRGNFERLLQIHQQNFIQVLVGFGTASQAGRSRVRFPMRVIEIFHLLNPSGNTMVLGSTQPLI